MYIHAHTNVQCHDSVHTCTYMYGGNNIYMNDRTEMILESGGVYGVECSCMYTYTHLYTGIYIQERKRGVNISL